VARVTQAYRERHQGPVLRRASEIFARITRGSFGGLVMDYEDDRQMLLDRRAEEAENDNAPRAMGFAMTAFVIVLALKARVDAGDVGSKPVADDDEGGAR